MQNDALRNACLGATLAVAWAGSGTPAVAAPYGSGGAVYIRTNFYHSLAAAQFLAIRDLTWIRFDLGAIPAGESYRELDISKILDGNPLSYNLMLGATRPPGQLPTTILGVGFVDPSEGLGHSFDAVFPGISESDALAGLLGTSSDGGLALDQMSDGIAANTNMYLGIDEPAPYTVLHFTDGTLLGTVEASFTPIPEPGAGVIGLGVLGAGVLRRYRVNTA